MCGICGFIKNNGKIEEGAIEKMLLPLARRGPDAKGIFYDNDRVPFAALGHRRLSIIDLKTGDQPMQDQSGNFSCVHNGEIYNFLELRESLAGKGYRFKTNSDTEVILNMYREYGKECVKHFNGMFAFAIWDKKERSIFLARDRVGIKPLYYYHDRDNFLFASSLKSFLGFNFIEKKISPAALSEYLQYLYINAPRTIFGSIRKLQAGSTLLFKNDKITIEKYWDITRIVGERKNNFIRDEKKCMGEIKSLLANSVKSRLISDVPLGVFLSGGVDSSIITALAAKSSNKRVKTFSVTFKGRGYYDESKFAKKISGMFETDHNELEITPNLKSDLSKIVDFLDEPFADSSFIPTYYLSDFTRNHVKVALSGTGGDDIFAGYRRYAVDAAVNMFDKSPGFIKKAFSLVINSVTPTRQSKAGEKALLARRFFKIAKLEKEKRHDAVMSFINKDMQKTLLENSPVEKHASSDVLTELSGNFNGQPYINQALYTDFLSYLAGDLLIKEDAATMAVGLEGRLPFLDHRLVEYSFGIDPALKLKGLSTKYILKKAFEDVLPRDILYREKHGFAFPVSEYLREGLKDTAQDILLSDTHKFFNKNAVETLFKRHLDGTEDLGSHIWALLVFNLWYEKNVK